MPTLQAPNREDKDLNPGARHAEQQLGYNPVNLSQAERDAFQGIADNYDSNPPGRTVQPQDPAKMNVQAAKEAEEAAGDDDNNRIKVNRSTTGDGGDGRKRKKGIFRGKGPLALIMGGLGISTVTIGGFFGSLALGPFAFVANITNDLDDLTPAMDITSSNLARTKALDTTERNQALAGCTILSFRCKFATLSNTSIERLRRAGIIVIAAKEYRNPLGQKRTVPGFYQFQGNQFTAEEWAGQLRTNGEAQRAQRKAINMKFVSFTNSSFYKHVLERFGINKRPPELSGSVQERVNALLNKAGTNEPGELRFVQVEGTEDDPRYTLEGDISNPPTQYTQAQVDEMEKSITDFQERPPISRTTKAAIGALSVVGYQDLACSISNLVGAGIVAAQVANKLEIIRYVAPLLAGIQGWQAVGTDPANAEAYGQFFSDTDSRQQITDITSSLESDDLATMENPSYGKSAYDSGLHQMSVLGGVATPAPQFSLGLGATAILAGLGATHAVINEIINLGNAEVCSIVQSWGVRLLGAVATVALTFASGGTWGVNQVITMGLMIAAMFTLEQIINNALDGSIIEAANLEEDTEARGDAVWTGIAGISSTNAQSSGLPPASDEEIVEYHTAYQNIKDDYIAIERENAHPLDIKNPYSFMGTFAQSIQNYTSASSSFLSNIGSIVRTASVASLTDHVSAANIDSIERFRQCDNEQYKKLGIDADVQCNTRHYMPKSALALDDPLIVAGWMENNGYVEKDSTTGFPKGYTPIDPAAQQSGIRSFISGTVDSFTGQFIDKRAASIEDYNDYAKFLDYCAYRIKPYGDTFEDNNPANGADKGWITGDRCREKSRKMDMFRMYTLYKISEDGPDVAYGGGSAETAPLVSNPMVSWATYAASIGGR